MIQHTARFWSHGTQPQDQSLLQWQGIWKNELSFSKGADTRWHQATRELLELWPLQFSLVTSGLLQLVLGNWCWPFSGKSGKEAEAWAAGICPSYPERWGGGRMPYNLSISPPGTMAAKCLLLERYRRSCRKTSVSLSQFWATGNKNNGSLGSEDRNVPSHRGLTQDLGVCSGSWACRIAVSLQEVLSVSSVLPVTNCWPYERPIWRWTLRFWKARDLG